MLNFDSLLRLFSDWSNISLLYGAGILICSIILIQELVLFLPDQKRRDSIEKR